MRNGAKRNALMRASGNMAAVQLFLCQQGSLRLLLDGVAFHADSFSSLGFRRTAAVSCERVHPTAPPVRLLDRIVVRFLI